MQKSSQKITPGSPLDEEAPECSPSTAATLQISRNPAGRFKKVTKTARYQAFAQDKIFPASINLSRKSHKIITKNVVPSLQKGAGNAPRLMKQELGKMHQKQHFWERFKSALIHKSLGLILAMFSADLVGYFFEQRRASNLWGITAKGEIVSHETFTVIIFIVEFIIAMVVFTLTDHYLDEFKQRRQKNK